MTKFAVFDQSGIPQAFYDEDFHGEHRALGSLIPDDAVAITDEQWAEFLTFPGQRRWNGAALEIFTPPAPAFTSSDIDAERDRRLAAGFIFGGKVFQAREQDLRNINGAATGAALAMMQGAQAGNMRWQGGDSDFGWIAADNTIMPMDVLTMIAFGRAAMTHVERLTMVGRSLKDRLAAGETIDISNDALWGE